MVQASIKIVPERLAAAAETISCPAGSGTIESRSFKIVLCKANGCRRDFAMFCRHRGHREREFHNRPPARGQRSSPRLRNVLPAPEAIESWSFKLVICKASGRRQTSFLSCRRVSARPSSAARRWSPGSSVLVLADAEGPEIILCRPTTTVAETLVFASVDAGVIQERRPCHLVILSPLPS